VNPLDLADDAFGIPPRRANGINDPSKGAVLTGPGEKFRQTSRITRPHRPFLVQKPVQQQSPEGIRLGQHGDSEDVLPPGEAGGLSAGGEREPRAKAELGDDVELDPCIRGCVVRQEEGVRPLPPRGHADQPEVFRDPGHPREVRASHENVDVAGRGQQLCLPA